VRSGTIKKRKSFVPETIKKRLESYPGWSDLVRLRKNGPIIKRFLNMAADSPVPTITMPRLKKANDLSVTFSSPLKFDIQTNTTAGVTSKIDFKFKQFITKIMSPATDSEIEK